MGNGKKDVKYFFIPIQLFKEAFTKFHKSLDMALCYCVYDYLDNNFLLDSDLGYSKKLVQNYYGISLRNYNDCIQVGKQIKESLPAKAPKASISVVAFKNYYEKESAGDFSEKEKFDVVVFLAYAGLKSYVQRQAYKRITNKEFISRMAGNAKSNEPLPEWISKYSTRYQLDRIKKELQLNWGLSLYGFHTRGFYVSFDLNFKELVRQVEKKRRKRKCLIADKMKVIQEVKNEVYGNQWK